MTVAIIKQKEEIMEVKVQQSFWESFKDIVNESFIHRIWRDARHWIKFHFTKDYWKVLKSCLKSYPWDEYFMFEIDKSKIEEMINYHKKHQRFIGWENVVRDMKICLSLIDIFTEKRKIFGFDGELKFKDLGDGTSEVLGDELKYHCDVYVNLKNINRFVPIATVQEYVKKHPHELYLLKARALYFKIRNERGGEWWD